MRSTPYPRLAGALLLATAACGGDDPSPDASGVAHDGATIDAAVIDGPPIDAMIDARPIDAMIDAPVDAPPPATVNGCTEATAVDRTAAGASRVITFPGFAYSPRCIKVKLGQTVTWSGVFMTHPLRQGVIVGGMPTGQPGNPIAQANVGMSASTTFQSLGDWGYYCNLHWPGGMTGAVHVVP